VTSKDYDQMSSRSEAAGHKDDGLAEWQRRYAATPERDEDFTTLSEVPVPPLVGPDSHPPDFERIGYPGDGGPSASSRALAASVTPISATTTYCAPASTGCRWPLTCRR
jgi:hypothetical protein